MGKTDLEWLRAYATDGDEAAFAPLIDRHTGWILAAARRRLHDEHLAEDATQVVFMLLASKAGTIAAGERDSVAAWLFHAMHLTCGRLRRYSARLGALAHGAATMMQQTEAIDFTIWSAEFFVRDVEANLDFFEKLGFRRHFIDQPDAMGCVPRASLRGGKSARIWLPRESEAERTRPTPGVTLFFWIDGGSDALTARRDAISAQGVKPSPFFDDVTLRNFTLTSPDGYTIGFFTAYK